MKSYLAVIGDPVKHTLSPAMHNAAFQAQGLPYIYLPFQVPAEGLRAAVDGMRVMGFRGFNVTIPHKVAVMALLDEISEEAEMIGSVNTVHLEDGRWVGYNTDGRGFLRSIEEDGGIEPAGLQVLILGAGGAARAAAVQLGLAGVKEVIMANRTAAKAAALADELAAKISGTSYRAVGLLPEVLGKIVPEIDLIVNATPAGMVSYPVQELPLKAHWFHPGQAVVDLVYRPRITPLIELARRSGARTITGEGMLLYQGAEAYRIWTGVEPPSEVMRQVLLEQLGAN